MDCIPIQIINVRKVIIEKGPAVQGKMEKEHTRELPKRDYHSLSIDNSFSLYKKWKVVEK